MKSLPPRASRRLEMLLLEDRVVPAVAWSDLAAIPPSPSGAANYTHPDAYRAIAIDTATLHADLASAPTETAVRFGLAAGQSRSAAS